MWRSLFLAIGIFSLILGGETLVVDKYTMASGRKLPQLANRLTNTGLNSGFPIQQNSTGGFYQQAGFQPNARNGQVGPFRPRVVQTKDWMPWSLLATGAIIVLYTYSLPRGHRDD